MGTEFDKLDCQPRVILIGVIRADFAVGGPAKFFKLPQVGLWLLSDKQVGSFELIDEPHGTRCDVPEPHHTIFMTGGEEGGGGGGKGEKERGEGGRGRERKEGGEGRRGREEGKKEGVRRKKEIGRRGVGRREKETGEEGEQYLVTDSNCTEFLALPCAAHPHIHTLDDNNKI